MSVRLFVGWFRVRPRLVAKNAFGRADSECRAFLAANGEGNGAECHGALQMIGGGGVRLQCSVYFACDLRAIPLSVPARTL